MNAAAGGRLPKLRDSLTLFAVAASGTVLEALILSVWWPGRKGAALQLDRDRFLLYSQVYVILSCVAVHLVGRRVVKPLEGILEGITVFGEGRLDHRIQPSRVRELDELARDLNRMAAKLSELDTLKNDFIANVSHELRSPLAAMEDYVKLLLAQAGIAGRDRENLLRLDTNLARLRRLVEELLDISQIEARQVRVRPEVFELTGTIRELCALFKPQIDGRGLSLTFDAPREPVRVEADAAKVRQILTNLLDNAIKYNRADGRIDIAVTADAELVEVHVKDAGAGIPAAHLHGLFERFRRLPQSSPEASRIKGAGLGLAISRGLARALGGDIRVTSEAGVGSDFTFSLPRTP